jgi:hypothetical protein
MVEEGSGKDGDGANRYRSRGEAGLQKFRWKLEQLRRGAMFPGIDRRAVPDVGIAVLTIAGP